MNVQLFCDSLLACACLLNFVSNIYHDLLIHHGNPSDIWSIHIHTVVLSSLLLLLLSQIDNASAQYVLKMMVQQHMFFRTEYEYVKWIANGHRYSIL